ncbi:hypothetical protein BH11PAT4_BH11PAT4_6160 [soil metagenome]
MHRAAHTLRICLSLLTGALLIWQLSLFATGSRVEVANSWFNAGYALVFMASALLGFTAHKRRYISGAQGKALWFFSLGSLSFAIALLIYAYSGIVLNVATPFPSSADLFFTFYIISAGAGCFAILELLGPVMTRKVVTQSIVAAFLVFCVTFAFLVYPALTLTKVPLIQFFTVTYPILACALMTLILIIARSSAGSSAHSLKLYFISLSFLAVGLILFLYRHNSGTYWNGDITDFFCMMSGYMSGLAAIELGWGEA